MEQRNDVQPLYKRPGFRRPRAFVVMFVLGFSLSVGLEAKSGEIPVETKIACSNSEVPTLILTLAFPRDVTVIKHALRTEVCKHTEEATPVTPVFFLRRVKTTPASAEPYGYIWAIRLSEQKTKYWFFWKGEHEAMLKRTPGT